MKKKILIVTLCFFTVMNLYTQTNAVPENVFRAFREAGIQVLTTGVRPSDFSLPLLDGTTFTLSQLQGRGVFLNFWATWCPPCRAEMPSMEALYQRLKDRGLEIIAVNLGESRNTVSNFMTQYNLSFPAALDLRSSTGSLYGVQAVPTTYIIDRRGLVVARLVGSIDWNTPRVITAFETLLQN